MIFEILLNGKTEQYTRMSVLFCTNFIFTKMMNRLIYLLKAIILRTEKYRSQWFQR